MHADALRMHAALRAARERLDERVARLTAPPPTLSHVHATV
jgi:hypothetical protein